MRTTIFLRFSVLLAAMVAAAVVVVGMLSFSSLASAQVSTQAVPGTTIKVNTKADENNTDGDCSLREAILAANTNQNVDGCAAGSSTDTDAILFALGDKATIKLGSQLPTITDEAGLLIDGRKSKIKVSGDDSVGDAVRVFEVSAGAVLNLSKLTVTHGKSGDFGGGIFNFGTLTVTNSTFSDNSAVMTGGGIDNRGTLTVTNSTFSNNSTTNPSGNNFGGGIFNVGESTVSKSTFSSNSSLQGGGISNFRELTVTNSTFSGNTSAAGGGIHQVSNATSLTVTNSTFSGNSATQLGGSAIFNQDGLPGFPSSPVMISNTIVANSTQGTICSGTITDGGYNIEDGTSCGFQAANNSMPSTEPKLASSLAKNGGPTKTIALLKGSPALNAIPNLENGCGTDVTTDQRGIKRPQGAGCDIGSFEKKK